MIIRNIDPTHIQAMDLGKKRTLQDIMNICEVKPIPGLTNSVLSSVVAGIYISKQFGIKQRGDVTSKRIDRVRGISASPVELYEFLLANPEIPERLKKLSKRDLSSIKNHVNLPSTIIGWYLCDVIDEKIADQILTTMEECVPQTSAGKQCPAFAVYQHIQKAKANDTTIHKYFYPGMFLWALDQIKLNIHVTKGKNLSIENCHLPCQGHEGTSTLLAHLKSLKDVK